MKQARIAGANIGPWHAIGSNSNYKKGARLVPQWQSGCPRVADPRGRSRKSRGVSPARPVAEAKKGREDKRASPLGCAVQRLEERRRMVQQNANPTRMAWVGLGEQGNCCRNMPPPGGPFAAVRRGRRAKRGCEAGNSTVCQAEETSKGKGRGESSAVLVAVVRSTASPGYL